MPFQPGSGNEFTSAGVQPEQSKAQQMRKADGQPKSLHDVLSEMDCVISLSHIPDLFADDDDDMPSSAPNLFAAPQEAGDDTACINILRQTGRNRAGQGRVLALHRRAVRAQMRQLATARQADHELRRLRSQIFTVPDEELALQDRPSVPLRIATHAIGLSLVATALPVGAAMMTYNLLKGEDIKVTARLTTLTGLALAILAGNPELALLIGA